MFNLYDQYSAVQILAMIHDSVVDGYCSACEEISSPHEPDATDNWCPCCESTGTVKSVLVLGGLC